MNLHEYDLVVVNSSGGKDSQTALRYVVKLAEKQDYPTERIHVVHADLGRLEWEGVPELVRHQASHYGLRCHVTRRKQDDTILDYVRRRGSWPSSTTRYCTSEFKRSPCLKIVTLLCVQFREAHNLKARDHVSVLNVFGFRAQESAARAKRQPLARNKRASNKSRTVDDWLPIHEWSEDEVWANIKSSGVSHHNAYDLGMPRLSCCFCIFAPRAALMVAGQHNRELLKEYVALEEEIEHDFQHKKPIADIEAALNRGETAAITEMHGCWNM